jgi:hypothetical protein
MAKTPDETCVPQRSRLRVFGDRAPHPVAVVPFRSSADLPVNLPPDLPADLCQEIARLVQVVFDHIVGEWTMSLERAPYESGRWRLELQGPTGTNIWTFMGGDHQLRSMIGRALKEFVRVAATEYQRRALAPRRAS